MEKNYSVAGPDRNGHLTWFIVLFIFSTLGILPIIYIFTLADKRK
ncbi:MAG: DUF5652 family protein [Dehalococcoidales bacterium]|jgi:hypothetical protein|nr:DUF5652 family protein [Dehalococcoidales bacterium]MDP6576492.1 DUF5652 family protein [Dehalococcoidales bacterium]|tara:strand:- start:811 stop:945 length:135 start_codon:yes stop_codon:yes gene_type:complete